MTVKTAGSKASAALRTAREDIPFSWRASCGMPVYAALAGVRFDRLFTEVDAIVEAYTVGQPLAQELFGEDVGCGGPGWTGISYGHVNGLGCPLVFPEDSEVAHAPIYDSPAAGIAALQRPVDWANAGMMPQYLQLWEDLKRAFPERQIGFGGFTCEGPITTAWELRGHGFFTDLHDQPEASCEYLRLVTESIIEYSRFIRSLNGQPAMVESGLGMCDDVASMVGPRQWPEMVMPFLDLYYAGQTSGRRSAHIEDLIPEHLHFLDELGLCAFDPSVSPRLQPRDLRDGCSVPFSWRLNEMQARDFSDDEVRAFVYGAAADGASSVTCSIGRTQATLAGAAKLRVFIAAGKEVQALLADGVPREDLRARQ